MIDDLIKRQQEKFEDNFGTFITNNDYHSNRIKDFLSSSIRQVVKEVLEEVKQVSRDYTWKEDADEATAMLNKINEFLNERE